MVTDAKYFGKISQCVYHADAQTTKDISQLKMLLTLFIKG